MYAIVESPKTNELDVFKYLEYLLRKLPNIDTERYEALSEYVIVKITDKRLIR